MSGIVRLDFFSHFVAGCKYAGDYVLHNLGVVVDVHRVGLDDVYSTFRILAVGVPGSGAEAGGVGDMGSRFAVDHLAFEEPVEHLLADGLLQAVVGQQVGTVSRVVVFEAILFL